MEKEESLAGRARWQVKPWSSGLTISPGQAEMPQETRGRGEGSRRGKGKGRGRKAPGTGAGPARGVGRGIREGAVGVPIQGDLKSIALRGNSLFRSEMLA